MCGICYARSLVGQPTQAIIRQQFKNQRNRGTQGFGFVANLEDHTKLVHKTDEAQIIKALRHTLATEILFHHRLPTSTANVQNACHPFKVEGIKTGHKYSLVHNGIVWNDDELKADHDSRGIEYKSLQTDGRFNDSEALAVEVMLCLEGAKYWKTFNAEGSIAFICLEEDQNGKPVKIHYGRNSGSPLVYRNNGKTIQISSEGNGESVKVNTLFTQDYATNKITEKSITIKSGSTTTYSNYGTWYDDGYSVSKSKSSGLYARYEKEFDIEKAQNYPEYEDGFMDIYDGYELNMNSSVVEGFIEDLSDDIANRGLKYDRATGGKKQALLEEIGELRIELSYYEGCRDAWKCLNNYDARLSQRQLTTIVNGKEV